MPSLLVKNPATGGTVGEVQAFTRDEVQSAVKRARASQPAWTALGVAARVEVLRKFQTILLEERQAVAALITSETGKPLTEALGSDVLAALDSVAWTVKHAEKVLSPRKQRLSNPLFIGRVSFFERSPLGVVGIISPWNYPLSIPVGNAVHALAAGNAVVLKPASYAPMTGVRIGEMLRRAGVPDDVMQVCPGSGREAGEGLVDADIDHLVFTGSVPVGREVDLRLRARGVSSTMELGGSDAAIVLADAPLDLAVRGVLWGRFTNAGQTCAATKRAFVHRSVFDVFVADLVAKTSALRLGDPTSPHVDVGALTDPRSVEEMAAFVEDAKKRGGRVLCGGRARPDLGPQYFEPTVVVDLPPEARLLTEECFGPILPVVAFDDEADAVRMANGTPFGLAGSVWTKDLDRGHALARRIDTGTVVLNDVLYTFAATETPWGGVKSSGHGTTHGPWGLQEMTCLRHVNVVPPRMASPWWFPYSPGLRDMLSDGARFLYGRVADKAKTGAGVTANILRRIRR
jgi:succinate-semialdehyde dehydrogenase/glutarate-semialdehyde dehydrogenase